VAVLPDVTSFQAAETRIFAPQYQSGIVEGELR
jgi:hypothetical protein